MEMQKVEPETNVFQINQPELTEKHRNPAEVDLELVFYNSEKLNNGQYRFSAIFIDDEQKQYEFAIISTIENHKAMLEQVASKQGSKCIGFKSPRLQIQHFTFPKTEEELKELGAMKIKNEMGLAEKIKTKTN